MSESVLVVDGDPADRVMLGNALSTQLPRARVTLLGRGDEALASLGERLYSLALVDAAARAGEGQQRPLWQQLLEERPHLPFFLLGSGRDGDPPAPEHTPRFPRPLPLEELVGRAARSLADSITGELHGMDLPAFLQVIELERKTCTVLVQGEDRCGTFVFEHGALVHARRADLAGDAAALDMLCWERPHIGVRDAVPATRNVVTRLSQLLLEAFRIFDERAKSALTGHAPPPAEEPEEPAAGEAPPDPPCSAEDLVDLAPGLLHGFVVGRRDGRILLAAGEPFEGDARGFARAVTRAHDAASMASAPAALAEMVSTAGSRSTLVRRSARSPDLSIVLVMKRNSAACALAAQRLRLRGW